jgi:hypothetical protein
MAHYCASHIYAFSGDYARAVEHADRALRLSPFDPLAWESYWSYAFVALHERHHDAAANCFAKAAQVTGGAGPSVFAQAACLALSGRVDEGRSLVLEAQLGSPAEWLGRYAQTSMPREILDLIAEGSRRLETAAGENNTASA